jgi:hypothetical protein
MNPFLLWSLPRLSLNRNDRPRTEPEVRRIKKDNRDEGGSNLIPTGDSIAQRHTYFSLSQSSSPSSLTTRIKRMHDNVIRAPCIFKILRIKEAPPIWANSNTSLASYPLDIRPVRFQYFFLVVLSMP